MKVKPTVKERKCIYSNFIAPPEESAEGWFLKWLKNAA